MNKKPWEETWKAHGRAVSEDPLSSRGVASVHSVADYGADAATAEDRATLIAAAPELVRVLIDIEWKGGEELAQCPSCLGLETPLSTHPAGHEPDCKLVDALRKAGVR